MAALRTIIDCDLNYDDAINLWLAIASPGEIDIVGVTTVVGSSPLGISHLNARLVTAMARRSDIPVYAGCSRPLFVRAPVPSMGGIDGLDLFVPSGRLMSKHGVDFMIETLEASAPQSVTIVATGPLTNIAMALIRRPQIAGSIARVIMTAAAEDRRELNIRIDPHAAGVVFEAGVPIVALGLEATERLIVTSDWIGRCRAIGNDVSAATATMLACAQRLGIVERGKAGVVLHAACSMAFLLAPALFETTPCSIDVDTRPGNALGNTHIGFPSNGKIGANTLWVTGIDVQGVLDIVERRLRFFEPSPASGAELSCPPG